METANIFDIPDLRPLGRFHPASARAAGVRDSIRRTVSSSAAHRRGEMLEMFMMAPPYLVVVIWVMAPQIRLFSRLMPRIRTVTREPRGGRPRGG